jgi:hypothetical protein
MLIAQLRHLAPRVLALLLVGATAAFPLTAAADTVMITGANSGIGLEFAQQYAEQGWTVNEVSQGPN